MRHRGILLLFCFLLASAGCQQSALMQIKSETFEREQRIPEKERHLSELESQKRILQDEKGRLQREIETKKLTLDQLLERLETLQIENARIPAENLEQQKEKERFAARLKEYRDEIEALKSDDQFSYDDRVSRIEKQKRIEELQEKIRIYLELGLE